jgi:hypothetical protein
LCGAVLNGRQCKESIGLLKPCGLTLSRHPELVTHVFSVCTPYTPAHEKYNSLEDLVKGPLPQFGYQIHLASGEVEKIVNSEETIRQFLKGVYGATGPNREAVFDPVKGIIAENLPKVGESRILNGKVSLLKEMMSDSLDKCYFRTLPGTFCIFLSCLMPSLHWPVSLFPMDADTGAGTGLLCPRILTPWYPWAL